jgi:DNA polymerase-3 subunit epsilon
MTRQIVLDTETTGIDPKAGHRIVEIGAVELANRRVTKHTFHHYLNPDRQMDEEVMQIHGIRNEFLVDKPHFADIVDDFMAFIEGAELIIHNAPFDIGHLNAELARLSGKPWQKIESVATITDSLALAKKRFPGQKNSLDALCKRLGVDNSQRTFHGALLDSEILADVYLLLTGGQSALGWEAQNAVQQQDQKVQPIDAGLIGAMMRFSPAPSDHQAHRNTLEMMAKKNCVWLEKHQQA